MASPRVRSSTLSLLFGAWMVIPAVALAQAPAPGQPPGQPLPPGAQPAPVPPGQPVPGQPAPGQPAPGQPAPGQPAPGQPAPGQPAPGPAPAQPDPTPPALQPMPSLAPQPAPAPPVLEPTPAPLPKEDPLNVAPTMIPSAIEPEPSAWYDTVTFSAFADAFFAVDFNFPKGRRPDPVRAYDANDGFSLSWVGLDIEKAPDPVGGTLSLRFGPTAERLAGACVDGDCDSEYGLSFVKQGFASWRPGGADGAVRLDLGKFDTPYGAEVAESQYNLNYTRGVLYWLGQPAYHTGLRLTADIHRAFALKLLAVNGWNRTIDNNLGKTFGLQATARIPASGGPDDDLATISLGYMVGPEFGDTATIQCPEGTVPDPTSPSGCEDDALGSGGEVVVDRGGSNTDGLRHFLDLAVVLAPSPALSFFVNGSLGIEKQRSAVKADEFESVLWFGAAAAGRYAVSDEFGIAARGEYFLDKDGYTTGFAPSEITLVTGTLTFDYSPAQALKLFLDGRVDWSDREIFPSKVRERVGTSFTATLGAVVMTY